MTKPSERIVVFVTTAQKRAITQTAEDLGISVSELMRRAVLSFGATSEQVKAASIVDRLRAPRAPDALNAALQRVARGTRHARATTPASVPHKANDAKAPGHAASAAGSVNSVPAAADSAHASSTGDATRAPSTGHALAPPSTGDHPASLLPAGVAAALAAEQDEQAAATAEAVARLTAARAAEADDSPPSQPQPGSAAPLRNSLKRRRLDKASDDDEPRSDTSTEGGRFA
ncbi:hypothetical protein [Burkholderia sp. Ax-1724]|uniref:hypothetical protein n=1 Tax=Burkholderia sp. Ax-1724 TaxID=2608336 RepID=UPI00141F5A04|nr:hypothetical protein [Burkholderia sp. Ax-1724]NIF54754.1 hypothetical protein [Burkholderia sp. Ax-1724]